MKTLMLSGKKAVTGFTAGCVMLILLILNPDVALSVEGFSFVRQYKLASDSPSLIVSMGSRGYAVYDNYGGGKLMLFDGGFTLRGGVSLNEIPDHKVSGISGMAYDFVSQQIVAFDARSKLLMLFSPDGALENVMSLATSGPDPLSGPTGIAVDFSGLIYIGDPSGKDIKVFSRQGTYLFPIHVPLNVDGKRPPFHPASLGVLENGTVVALDRKTRNIFSFSREGEFLFERRLEGDYHEISRVIPLQSGDILGLDGKHQKIYKWDSAGRLKSGFGSRGNDRGQFNGLADITCDPEGNIVALDTQDHDIQVFAFETPSLALVSEMRNLEYSVVQTGIREYGSKVVGLFSEGAILFDKVNKEVIIERAGAKQVLKHEEFKNITRGLLAYDKVYLFDSSWWKSKVFVFNAASGRYESTFGASGVGRFDDVVRILPGKGNTLFFADQDDTNIKVFSSEGIFSTSFGKRGKEIPSDIERLQDITWHKGNLAVLDSGRNMVHLFDSRGGFVGNIDVQLPAGKVKLVAIASDPNGYLLLLDARNSRVLVIDENGKVSFMFGSRGKRPQDWTNPEDLMLNNNGLLKVAEGGKSARAISYQFTSAGPLSQAEFAIQNRDWDRARKILDPYLTDTSSELPEYMRAMRLSMRAYSLAEGKSFLTEAQLSRVRQALRTFVASNPESVLEHMALAYSLKHDGKIEEAMAVLHAGKRNVADPRYEKMLRQLGAELEAGGKTTAIMAIVDCKIPVMLAALSQNYYDTPVIELTLANNGGKTAPASKATFFAQAIMDNPTETDIPPVDPFSTVTVNLKAAFSRNILTYEEDSIMSGEILVRYGDDKESLQVLRRNVTFQLLSRNSIDWNQEEMITCFITLKDPDVQLFARQAIKVAEVRMSSSDLDEHLYKALALFDAMQSIGLYYAPDPRQPFNFADFSQNGRIDYVQFPRETLTRQSGDCDDLSVLYAALLEASGIPTIMVTSPGHIFTAFQLAKGRQSIDSLGLSPDLLIERNGQYYVPVETTLLGSPFISAWRVAAGTIAKYKKEGSIGFIDLQDAWTKYKTVSLPPADRTAPVPDEVVLATLLSRELDALNLRQIEKRLAVFKAWLDRDKNNVTLLMFLSRSYSMVGMFDVAIGYAERAEQLDKNNPDVYQVLGNIAYMQNNYAKALDFYKQSDKMKTTASVQINIALCCLKSGQLPAARTAYKEAKKLDAKMVGEHPELTQLLE